MPLTVTVETKGLDVMKAIVEPKNFAKSVSAGLRYASSGFNREAAKQIGSEYVLAAARIKKDISRPRVSGDSMEVTLKRRPPTLRAYGAKELKSGALSYQIFRQGGRQARSSTYFWMPARMKTDEGMANVRLPFKRLGPGRNNIIPLFGPSVGSIFARDSKYGDSIRQSTLIVIQAQHIKGIERDLSRKARGF